MPAKTRPKFSTRMASPTGLDQFQAPEPKTGRQTWHETHHRRTSWISDELWERLSDEAAAANDGAGRSKSLEVEQRLREVYGMNPHPEEIG